MRQRSDDARLTAARVARLATTDPDGRPHLVPIVFALDGDTLYSAVDRKPKRSSKLRRIDCAGSGHHRGPRMVGLRGARTCKAAPKGVMLLLASRDLFGGRAVVKP